LKNRSWLGQISCPGKDALKVANVRRSAINAASGL